MIRSLPRLSISARDVQSVKPRNLSLMVSNLLHARLKSPRDNASFSILSESRMYLPVLTAI